ncbi:hypothetical protein M5X00_04945 [Paenibacillus alvei]|uniref:hypothetical protein n=1 Tax=Paenibacillus alvei TaxID=44250 RepID=UPI0021D08D7C|nr:hypothetical protein [Paenibacillus alvei]MCY9539098.1 hypothetical protein [Paenibacillus alvei]MCY9707977.1 hypothetical protein [Paenibacillus alvei]MCY9734428.1 hypothetical protein [Paenibacillus alvei]MCY9753606.1 hypothetical protein [Paenibacillus alvei]MEC0078754.1 hypothetical protein [Paenibacillus alvei]
MKERKKLSEIIRDTVDITAETGTSIISDLFLEGTIGQIAPGLVAIKNSYKQKKFEERMLLALKELSSRQEKIEASLSEANNEQYEFIKNTVLPLYFDYASESNQDDKIKIFANGVEYITCFKLTEEDIAITYFDVLKELTLKELNLLLREYAGTYVSEEQLTLDIRLPVSNEEQLHFEQLQGYKKYVDSKLFRMGLIEYEEEISYLPKRIDEVGYPPKYDLTSFRISDFGRNFVSFFKNR